MGSDWAPPSKGQHLFVVLRHDDFIGDPVDAISATKVFGDLDRAQAEADRLNALNSPKGARYFVRVARWRNDSA